MKKMMCAFAIALCAVVANASNVQWGLAAGNTLDATKVEAGTMYLCYTTGSMDWSKLDGMTEFTKESLYMVGATDIFDSFSYSSAKVNNAKTITPTTVGPDSAAAIGGGAKTFDYVCIDDGGKDIAYVANGKVINLTNSPMGTGSFQASSAFTYATASEVIPEPTSGLLMLLGMAGLALRRRRA